MPVVLLAGTWGGTLVGGDLMTHFKLLLIRPWRFLLLPSFRLHPQPLLRVGPGSARQRGETASFFACTVSKEQV